MSAAYLTEDPSRTTDAPALIHTGSERDCRRAAARALGARTLRGLRQAVTDRGVRFYATQSDDHEGPSVELVY